MVGDIGIETTSTTKWCRVKVLGKGQVAHAHVRIWDTCQLVGHSEWMT